MPYHILTEKSIVFCDFLFVILHKVFFVICVIFVQNDERPGLVSALFFLPYQRVLLSDTKYFALWELSIPLTKRLSFSVEQ